MYQKIHHHFKCWPETIIQKFAKRKTTNKLLSPAQIVTESVDNESGVGYLLNY